VTGVTHENLAERLAENKAAIDKLTAEVAAMHGEFSSMREMMETYTAIKRGGKAVEWLSKVIAACLVIWAFVRGGLQLLADMAKS
jgi:hypothetical protein